METIIRVSNGLGINLIFHTTERFHHIMDVCSMVNEYFRSVNQPPLSHGTVISVWNPTCTVHRIVAAGYAEVGVTENNSISVLSIEEGVIILASKFASFIRYPIDSSDEYLTILNRELSNISENRVRVEYDEVFNTHFVVYGKTSIAI